MESLSLSRIDVLGLLILRDRLKWFEHGYTIRLLDFGSHDFCFFFELFDFDLNMLQIDDLLLTLNFIWGT